MRNLRALLWKDARLARSYLLTGMAVIAAPHTYFAIRYFVAPDSLRSEWSLVVYQAGVWSAIASLAVLALIGGASFATERSDRSAEFLAYLPLRRIERLASKAAIAVGASGLLLILNPLFLFGTSEAEQGGTLWTLAAIGLLVFGSAWLASTLASSAAAVMLGLLAPFFLTMLIYVTQEGRAYLSGLNIDLSDTFEKWFAVLAAGFGLLTLFIGSLLFVRLSEA